MSDLWNNENRDFEMREQILVVVNKDWRRTYKAFVRTVYEEDGLRYAASCELKDAMIVGSTENKAVLGLCMDELATVIEEYTSRKLPTGITLGKDLHCALN